MIKENELYKCKICGNIIEVVGAGNGELVCCSEVMTKIEGRKEEEEYGEKHIPVIKRGLSGEYYVEIGSMEHPMTEEHYIEFIELISEDGKYLTRKYLHPGEKAEIKIECKCTRFTARAYCNIHGLWESNVQKEE